MIQAATHRLLFMVALAATSLGCPGTLQDPDLFSGDAASAITSCPDVPQAVFVATCAMAQCHSAATKLSGLDLETANVASRLVGVSATGGPGLLIDPVSPQASVIYTKLTAAPPFGVRMPFAMTPLDAATIACVLDWVTAQADAAAVVPTEGTDASSTDAH